MFINGKDRVGQAKAYASVKEMELEKENQELKRKLAKAEQQLDLAVEALEFYGWESEANISYNDGEVIEFFEEEQHSGFNFIGERARQALKQIKEK